MSAQNDLQQPVGPSMPNLPADVAKVQQWLNTWAGGAATSVMHGQQASADWLHIEIQRFQREVLRQPAPTGRVSPHDDTARVLQQKPHVPAPQPRLLSPATAPPGHALQLPPRTGFQPLSDGDYAAAAKTLGCETRMIHAMAKKEGKDHGFDHLNRPVILFEPLHFRRLSGHAAQYKVKYPDLTHLQPKPHPYGTAGAQWDRLQRAYLLAPRAALESASWGKFQILGEYCRLAGSSSVELFVMSMCASEQNQLQAFVSFIQGKGLQQAFRDKDFAAIASGYNGTGYRASHYDTKLKAIYDSPKD